MPTYTSSRLRTVYAQVQTGGLRTVNNTAGTWANAASTYIRFEELTITPDRPLTEPTYKTGSASPLPGIVGRSGNSRFTLRAPVIPSGTAGTVPDLDPVLQSIMGAAPTGASYALSDAILPMTILHFDKSPGITAPNNFFILGAVPETATFTLNGPQLEVSVEGRCVGISHKSLFSSYTGVDAVLKGGLTTFPVEPGSHTTNGNIQPGFGGTATFGGTAVLEFRGSPRVVVASGIDYFADAFGEYYPVAAQRGLRRISLSGASFAYSDTAILQTILADTFTKGIVGVVLALTQGAGNNTSMTLGGLQLGSTSFRENGAFMDMEVADSGAHASAAGLVDDFVLAFS